MMLPTIFTVCYFFVLLPFVFSVNTPLEIIKIKHQVSILFRNSIPDRFLLFPFIQIKIIYDAITPDDLPITFKPFCPIINCVKIMYRTCTVLLHISFQLPVAVV